MRKVSYVLCLIGLLIHFFGCKIGEDQPSRELYEFALGIDVVTFKKEYAAGDIIFFQLENVGNTFTDLQTNEIITVPNAVFTFITRAEIMSQEPLPDTSEIFDLTIQNGMVNKTPDFNENGAASFSFGCPDSDYLLDFGLQIKSPGNYLLILNDLDQLSLILFTDQQDCSIHNRLPPDNADQAFVRFYFDETDLNLDVFDQVVGVGQNPTINYYRQLLENQLAFFLKVR